MQAKPSVARRSPGTSVLIYPVLIITFALAAVAVTDEAEVNWTVAPGGPIAMATGDAFGNAYILGQSGAALTKYDRLGNKLWTHQLATDHLNAANCVVGAAGGDCYVGGRAMGTTTPAGTGQQPVTGNHAFVARYAGDGTLVWVRLIGSTGNDVANRMVVDADDNCYVVGNTSGCIDGLDAPAVGTDPFVAKVSGAGDLIWVSQLREASSWSGLGVGVDEDGQVTITGVHGYVATYDSQGNLLQSHRFAHGIPFMQDVAADSLGNAYFCGWDNPYNAIVTKFSRDGVFQWEERFRLNGWSCPKSIAVVPDGSGDIMTGGCEGSPVAARGCQAFSRRLDSEGNLVSMCTTVNVCGQAVGVDSLGNWYVIGDTVVTKAGAPVYTFAPLLCEAEAATLEAGVVETAQADCSGDGYIRFDGDVEGHVEWTAGIARPGVKTLVWRFQNRTMQTVSAVLHVNGLEATPDLSFASTTDDDDWISLTAEVYLGIGNNAVALTVPASTGQGLLLDRLEIVDAEDNVAQDRAVTCSSESDAHPAAAALDGRLASCWSVSEYPQWIEIDLGQSYPVSKIGLTGRSDGPCPFTVETKLTSADSYQQVVDGWNSTEPLVTARPVVSTFARTPARYVRLVLAGSADSAAADLQEFGVFVSAESEAIAIGTQGYRTIQAALDDAAPGSTVTLQPGVYVGTGNGDLQWDSKSVILTSTDAGHPDVVAATVIKGTAAASVLSLTDLDADSRLVGLTVTGGLIGVSCQNASPDIAHCRIVGNVGPGVEMQVKSNLVIHHTVICANDGAGISMVPRLNARWPTYNEPSIVNCTIAHNALEGVAGGDFTMRNCIVWGNDAAGMVQLAPVEAEVSYSCIQNGFSGTGNIDADPLFLAADDYRLVPGSPCIDAGDPADPVGAEPAHHGDRINLGAYGGTAQATCAPARD